MTHGVEGTVGRYMHLQVDVVLEGTAITAATDRCKDGLWVPYWLSQPSLDAARRQG